jgi:transcription initiation factor TFIIIB Brf1 subunit/transcription initiation factor TFIIB
MAEPTDDDQFSVPIGTTNGGGNGNGNGGGGGSISCPQCGSEDIRHNDATGDAVCTNCGTVLEENLIVSTVEFTDNSAGGSSVVGQFVSSSCTKAFVSTNMHGYNKESREITIANGRRKIAEIAARLKLNQHFIDSAHRLFMLAVQRNFVQGRKTIHVIAACLYIVCRREKAPHLLIDFSDALQTNVYTLGSTFLKFSRLLNLKLPVIDPSLYIHRFAAKLELEDKTHGVAMTALRLVARMKRDWLHTGRRPSGICGAALILASRMNGFKRTQKEVATLLNICEETIRARLLEFEATPAADLTMESFLQNDLEGECDPPALVRNRLMDIEAAEALDQPGERTSGPGIERAPDVIALYEDIESDLTRAARASLDEEGEEAEEEEERASRARQIEEQNSKSKQHKSTETGDDDDDTSVVAARESGVTKRGGVSDSGKDAATAVADDAPDTALATPNATVAVAEGGGGGKEGQNEGEVQKAGQKAAADEFIAHVVSTGVTTPAAPPLDIDMSLDLTMSDSEDEDGTVLLTDAEMAKRKAIWERVHGRYLEEKARRDIANLQKRPVKKRPKRERDADGNVVEYTAAGGIRDGGMSAEQMRAQQVVKRKSKKLNYSVIEAAAEGTGDYAD